MWNKAFEGRSSDAAMPRTFRKNHISPRMKPTVDTALIPAAGLGTRVSAITRGGFKEDLRVGDRTLLEWTLHDLERSDVRRAVIVLSPAKAELARRLGNRRGGLEIGYAWQEQALGLAHALLLGFDCAPAPALLACLPDNVALAGEPIGAQLMRSHARFGGYVLGLLELPRESLAQFGSAGFVDATPIDGDHVRIAAVRAKKTPPPDGARVLKGFPASVLPEDFFARARVLCAQASGGESDDTPILQAATTAGAVVGRILRSTVFDCGSPAGHAAALAFGTS
jgi:UTP--glucose-1-phosphate uridylyltransferase